MKFSYGCNVLHKKESGEKQCYLLTNGLGGYSSLTLLNSLTRNDHALLMAATKAPDVRYHMVSRVDEVIKVQGKEYNLSSQKFVDHTKNSFGERYLNNVTKEHTIVFTYQVESIEVTKEVVLVHNENTLGVKYTIQNPLDKKVELYITPYYQFKERGDLLSVDQEFNMEENQVTSNGLNLHIHTNWSRIQKSDEVEFINDFYYDYDARDGRMSYGAAAKQLTYIYDIETESSIDLIFTMEDSTVSVDTMIENEINRQKKLIEHSGAKDELTKAFVVASDAFVVKRESIDGLTLMAGYPFFLDWGRDTMYTIEGACIYTNRFEESENILQTFVTHLKNGIMPNLFPEGDNPPLYNTVDAALLFIQAVYVHYDRSKDLDFVKKMYPAIIEIIENYKNGTDFDIKMDEDGLIQAGSGLMQLTWMDVRYQDILPTPRHGKPVEVNAFWYSGLCTAIYFGELLGKDVTAYNTLVERVKQNFTEKFYNKEKKCLKDVVSGNSYDDQIRCNQIWAVSVPFSPLSDEIAKEVVNCVYDKLYTPYGLRTLEIDDPQFVAEYGGDLKKRDLSYHQGTVWPFPLGSYFKAYLKVNQYSEKSRKIVKKQLGYFADCMSEGCVGQVAEIYDGLHPSTSRGCFAQGWSVSEILKIMLEVESYE